MSGPDEVDQNECNGNWLVGVSIALLILSWSAVGLRAYTRVFVMKSLQPDDWLMFIAQVLFTTLCASVLEGVKRGIGRHNASVTNEDDRVAALMWQAIVAVLYIITMMFVKLSIGVFLLRLSVARVYKNILRASLVIVTLWSVGVFLWDIFQCSPVEKQWDFRIHHGRCVSPREIVAAAYAISVMTILSDWLFAILPIPMLWNVKMTKQAKVTVISILGLGIFASIATLVRLGYLQGLENSHDLLYALTDMMVWSLVETSVAITASSLATIRPLLRTMKIRGFESTDRTASVGVASARRFAHCSPTALGYKPHFSASDAYAGDARYGIELGQDPPSRPARSAPMGLQKPHGAGGGRPISAREPPGWAPRSAA